MGMFSRCLYLQCKSLEALGYDSLMVIASIDRQVEVVGSSKGRRFLKAHPDYFQEFANYCKGEKLIFLGQCNAKIMIYLSVTIRNLCFRAE